MIKLKRGFLLLFLGMFALFSGVAAQGELAATLEVLSPGVTVLRVNTVNAIEISVEAIVGVGDVIRTNDTGRARITFFADGTDTELLPNTEYRIEEFEGQPGAFKLTVTLLAGQTVQRLSNLLDASPDYRVNTPGMTLAARGTAFALRVEDDGRSAMLVTEGTVDAEDDADSANVPPQFGIRSGVDEALSDVVLASSFDQLDAALDGCVAGIAPMGDVRLNVRTGPAMAQPRVGTVDPAEVDLFIGISESGGWYRIHFRGGFGWIAVADVDIETTCAGLRQFPDAHTEDSTLYEFIGDPIEMGELATPPTPSPSSEPSSEDEDDEDNETDDTEAGE